MGLFDGAALRGQCGSGSTADLASLTGWPVVLVLDVSGQSETAAAIALGCRTYRPDVTVAGVILNRVASARHLALIEPAFALLHALRGVRGTPLDVFGQSAHRRLERRLIGWYARLLGQALAQLTPANHAAVVAIATLPDGIRGYEQIKEANVAQVRARAATLLAELDLPPPPPSLKERGSDGDGVPTAVEGAVGSR